MTICKVPNVFAIVQTSILAFRGKTLTHDLGTQAVAESRLRVVLTATSYLAYHVFVRLRARLICAVTVTTVSVLVNLLASGHVRGSC
jgi:hypothetical protein